MPSLLLLAAGAHSPMSFISWNNRFSAMACSMGEPLGRLTEHSTGRCVRSARRCAKLVLSSDAAPGSSVASAGMRSVWLWMASCRLASLAEPLDTCGNGAGSDARRGMR